MPSSFPRNLFPITFRRPSPGQESPYQVDTSKLFHKDDKNTKERDESDCLLSTWLCGFTESEMSIYKLFYFLFYAAMAIFAYLPLYYKRSLLLDHHHVGFLMGIRPFCKFLGAPCLGALADKFNKYKSFLSLGLLAYIVIYFSITFVSGVPSDCGIGQANRTNATGGMLTKTLVNQRKPDSSAIKKHTDTSKMGTNNDSNKRIARDLHDGVRVDIGINNGQNLATSDDNVDFPIFDGKNVNEFAESDLVYYDNLTRGSSETDDKWIESPDLDSWPLDVYDKKPKDNPPELKKVQERIFLILLLMTIVAEFIGAPILSLADTATLQNLKKEPYKYGYQSVWGSIGFGLMSIVFGTILHFTVSTKEDIKHCPEKMANKYLPVFYGCCALLVMAFLSTFKFHFREYEGKDTSGCSIFKCIKYFGNIEYCLFIFLAWFTGVARGLSASFLYVHLMRLGATPLILLTTTTVQSISKVIFFLLSPTLIVKYGYFPVIYAGLISNVVMFFSYSFLSTPWMVVPIEFLAGISTSCIWAALASYVGAPPKIGATLQGILHAMHIGLGRGIGGLFGGMILVRYGFDWLFRLFGLVTFVVFLMVFGFRYWRKQTVEPIWKQFWDYSPISFNDELGEDE